MFKLIRITEVPYKNIFEARAIKKSFPDTFALTECADIIFTLTPTLDLDHILHFSFRIPIRNMPLVEQIQVSGENWL